MAKAEIDTTTLSFEQVGELIRNEFGVGEAVQDGFKRLYGGFSGSNYAVPLKSGGKVCIKVCNGYSREEVEDQATIMRHTFEMGFENGCHTIPRVQESDGFRFAADGKGLPAPTICLSFCEGQPADQVVEKGIQPQNKVLQEVGQQLANLHSISVDRGAGERPLRTYEQGGANFVNDHMQGVILSKMKGSEHALAHPFFKFYEVQLKELQSAMLEAKTLNVPVGVVHGDPFLDNCLVQSSGESFWVDFEDVTVGPLIFDFACMVIGSCFRQSPENSWDPGRFEALATGYFARRRLTSGEEMLLVKFLRLTLLCNCSWRFVNFNIDHREIEECRNAHVELEERIVALQSKELESSIFATVKRLNSAEPSKPRDTPGESNEK